MKTQLGRIKNRGKKVHEDTKKKFAKKRTNLQRKDKRNERRINIRINNI